MVASHWSTDSTNQINAVTKQTAFPALRIRHESIGHRHNHYSPLPSSASLSINRTHTVHNLIDKNHSHVLLDPFPDLVLGRVARILDGALLELVGHLVRSENDDIAEQTNITKDYRTKSMKKLTLCNCVSQADRRRSCARTGSLHSICRRR